MVRRPAWERASASGAWPSRSPRRTTLAASPAASMPRLIARPTSAVASAGASFTPSPTIATVFPSALSFSTNATLSTGRHPPRTSAASMPAAAAAASAAACASPEHTYTRPPSARSAETAPAASARTRSVRRISPSNPRPSMPTTTTETPCAASGPEPTSSAPRSAESAADAAPPITRATYPSRPTATRAPSTRASAPWPLSARAASADGGSSPSASA
mmetsp:Transcript_22197/g.71939  ORF Transcript_22197/g.71939 Transcript_22197/m.71939 type:complete len:218 (-) Transcript_22197:1731-2384(-)